VTGDVDARSPLQLRGDDLARIGASELAFVAQVSIRSRAPEALGLPVEPNTWTALPGADTLWLGPDEWLAVGRPGTLDDLFGTFASAGSIVDVSANRAIVELARDDRFRLFEQGCSIDLHPRSWREGMCAQTLLARVPVILQERTAATRVFVRPSYANWLVDWLIAVST
jgi:sarcosine oxidase, subunit gamma